MNRAMATQTATVARMPANGSAKTSGLAAAGGASTYSLTDEQLLAMEDAEFGMEAPPEANAEPEGAGKTGAAGGDADTEQGSAHPAEAGAQDETAGADVPAELARAFELPEVGPKLREIYERDALYRALFPNLEEARALRETFPDAEAARAASAAQQELARLDALVESPDPRAQAQLIAGLRQAAPEAFARLAMAFGEHLRAIDPRTFARVSSAMVAQALEAQRWPEHVALLARAAEQGDLAAVKFLAGGLARQVEELSGDRPGASRAAEAPQGWMREPRNGEVQAEPPVRDVAGAATAAQFLEAVNTNVEHAVRQVVNRKVEELLPDAAEGARQKVAGEIYRELDAALRQDPALLDQVRDAVRGAMHGASRSLGSTRTAADAQDALARLIASRARAALPGVAKRVVAEWTDTALRISQSRRSKQSEAASRVDMGRGGTPGRVAAQPRRVDYTRMSDAEILDME
jgi:hypothetical protein